MHAGLTCFGVVERLVALVVERVVLLAAGARADGEFAVGDRFKISAAWNRLLKQRAFDDLFESAAFGVQHGAAAIFIDQFGKLLALGGTGLAKHRSEPTTG